ncbi:PASTA domain-containing protein [bacterium]|nr:PASTA domain-containing protein [bacterium]MBU1651713.1 PASTA domain-containing protein [bacterium]
MSLFSSLQQWLIALIIVVLVFSLGALLVDQVVMPYYTRNGEELEVPDIVELKVEQADSVLRRHGFELVEEREQYDWTYPEGTVIAQNPEPFSITKRGRRIYVTVSIGEKLSVMPNLVGKSARDAMFTTQKEGLNLTEEDFGYEYSNYYPATVVMAQSIPPGTKLRRDTPLHMTVSLGTLPNEFKVPDVVGQTLERAKKQILMAGLEIGEVIFEYHPDLLPNTVMSQSPKPNEKSEQGAFIDLKISTLDEKGIEDDEVETSEDLKYEPEDAD